MQLPEHTKVYVSVPGDFEPISVHIASPHLMQPEQSVDFEKVISEASTLDPWPPEPA
ncbi:MAG: hypothetical protein ACKV0T_11275 [Planctomycetales bacterium]